MKWTLQTMSNKPTDFQIISDEGRIINFKYSSTQHSIRMRFEDHHGVYFLDGGSFQAKKLSIRNVYGSEIGTVTKGAWRESTGTITLDDISKKINYAIDVKTSAIEIEYDKPSTIVFAAGLTEEHCLLALIVFSWKESVIANQIAEAI